MSAVAFISVREYACIAVGFDMLFRFLVAGGDISLTCLFLGSDSALNDRECWVESNLYRNTHIHNCDTDVTDKGFAHDANT